MGYTTVFSGTFEISPPLSPLQITYLTKFSETRRMKRDVSLTIKREDPFRIAVDLPIGEEGAYFVSESEAYGQNHAADIDDYNHPPTSQPGLWCSWIPTEDGEELEWNGAEKFYYYVEWVEYLIEHFFKPWNRKLNGEVRWRGEDFDDLGKIIVKDNKVKVKHVNW